MARSAAADLGLSAKRASLVAREVYLDGSLDYRAPYNAISGPATRVSPVVPGDILFIT